MPSYKVSNKPRMHFCANNVVYSIHASLLLEVRQACAFQKLFEHTFTKQGSKTIFVPQKIHVIFFVFIFRKDLFYTKKQINKIITFNVTRSREKYII